MEPQKTSTCAATEPPAAQAARRTFIKIFLIWRGTPIHWQPHFCLSIFDANIFFLMVFDVIDDISQWRRPLADAVGVRGF